MLTANKIIEGYTIPLLRAHGQSVATAPGNATKKHRRTCSLKN
jgi:hypothetical protein